MSVNHEFNYLYKSVVLPSDQNPSKLQLYVNGVAAGPVYTANPAVDTWTQFVYNTNSGSASIINLELINQNIIAGGNDFALDDIVFQQILPATATTDVTVNSDLPVSLTIDYSPTTIYDNTPVTFTATPVNPGTTPTYVWTVNDVPVGTNDIEYTYIPTDGDVVKCVLTS